MLHSALELLFRYSPYLSTLTLVALSLVPGHSHACMIAIDAGHSKTDGGATSARGVAEWTFNATLSRNLARALEDKGVAFVMTNPTGDTVSLKDRTETAKRAGASLFVSLHHNSVQPHYLSRWLHNGRMHSYSDHFKGYGIFVSSENRRFNESYAVASAVADGFLARGLQPTMHHAEPIPGENRPLLDARRGIYQFDGLYVLRHARCAAILIEAGVIVNREEELELSTPEFQDKVVQSILHAIEGHCKKTD